MAMNYVSEGRALSLAAPVGGVVGGRGYAFGALFGVAAASAAAGEGFTLHVEGAWLLPKKTADVFTVGQAVYWDATAGHLTTTASGNTLAGHATVAATNTATVAEIRLAR